ncbi:alpha-ketoglutarate-dependent 2 [Colletotrichum orchidophilum]|uniref:Alpha-ketoglutarate-dependent 2 n=1 Tax=Colletotrichum orchidophilum TaxID=1209926 RepID=A0A1G4B490_9PEZI|nr:alpha-ketoglutarate-dependent 2 [Colletotrichum orchidophilum]OHE96239.1 alpha-ketoglutarate-dependent 2 [Colletotrichum orchidophilum]
MVITELQTKELSPSFGIGAHNFPLQPTSLDQSARLIEDLVKKYGFLVIRKSGLTDETHIALARHLGDLDDVKPYNKAGRANRLQYDELFDVGNIEADGSVIDPKSPRAQAGLENALFHKLAAPEHFANIEPADYPMGRHKLVQKHEPSGRMNLYLPAHIHHIENLTPEASKALFKKLFEHATLEKYRVTVEWEDVGDLVV